MSTIWDVKNNSFYLTLLIFCSEDKFNGHYCMVEFEVPDTILNTKCDNQPLEIHLGICLPASCNKTETQQIIEGFSFSIFMGPLCEIFRCCPTQNGCPV